MLITGKARRIFRQVETFILSGKCTGIEQVKSWDKNGSSGFSAVEFMREQLRKSSPTPAVSKHHPVLINRVERFGKIKTFAGITCSGICGFDSFLRQTGARENSTLNRRHSTFRRYIRKAVYMDLCKKDPYVAFKMPAEKGRAPACPEEPEIKKIPD
jgi:hypothetical protein